MARGLFRNTFSIYIDDVRAKFDHLQHDLAKTVADTLAYFVVKSI